MADGRKQSLLKEAWTSGPQGKLSAFAEAKAWALREVWREEGKDDYGFLSAEKQRPGHASANPSPASVKMDSPLSESDRGGFLLNTFIRFANTGHYTDCGREGVEGEG